MATATATLLVHVCVLGILLSVSTATARLHRGGPLPPASARPINADPTLDCAVKNLAWDFAKRLLPRQGTFLSAYNALQLEDCNISLSSGRRYKTHPFLNQTVINQNAMEIYVATNGNDSNSGTIDKPLKTLQQAVRLLRLERGTGQQGIIYLRSGSYYLDKTIDLGSEDSNLVISGYNNENVVVSGGKEYQFSWKEIVNEMGPVQPNVNTIYGTIQHAGDSNGKAVFYGKVDNHTECQDACEKNSSCFAFTWHDDAFGDFAYMCYFRVDGLWVRTPEEGTYSGKKLKLYMADLKDQSPNTFTTLFINGRRAIRARYPDGNPEMMGLHTDPTGYILSAQRWLPPEEKPDAVEINIQSPERTGTHFPQFYIGVGGPVAVLTLQSHTGVPRTQLEVAVGLMKYQLA